MVYPGLLRAARAVFSAGFSSVAADVIKGSAAAGNVLAAGSVIVAGGLVGAGVTGIAAAGAATIATVASIYGAFKYYKFQPTEENETIQGVEKLLELESINDWLNYREKCISAKGVDSAKRLEAAGGMTVESGGMAEILFKELLLGAMNPEKAEDTTAEDLEQAKNEIEEGRECFEVAKARMEMRIKQDREELRRQGIELEFCPTRLEVDQAKVKVQYSMDKFHFAVAGASGSGKSSLINAFLGLSADDKRAALVDTTEATSEIGRYPDPGGEPPRKWVVWFDIPGAGTLNIPQWQYFNWLGLFIYDLIIVTYDIRFTEIDVDILQHCHRLQIPSFIVRTKADQHIKNKMRGMKRLSSEEKRKLRQECRDQFIFSTCNNVRDSLLKANLPLQRVYIVSNKSLEIAYKATVDGTEPEDDSLSFIDEYDLTRDLMQVAKARRCINGVDEEWEEFFTKETNRTSGEIELECGLPSGVGGDKKLRSGSENRGVTETPNTKPKTERNGSEDHTQEDLLLQVPNPLLGHQPLFDTRAIEAEQGAIQLGNGE